jgi:hypothetical protein
LALASTHVAGLSDFGFSLQSREHLAKLPLDERVLVVPVGVVLDEYGACLFVTTLLGEPARGFRRGDEDGHDEKGTNNLDHARKPPGPL